MFRTSYYLLENCETTGFYVTSPQKKWQLRDVVCLYFTSIYSLNNVYMFQSIMYQIINVFYRHFSIKQYIK
jgi:hypothetical protein